MPDWNLESVRQCFATSSVNWGPLGQWVAALVTLAVLIYAVWKDFWMRPKLLLSFENDRDVKKQDNTVGLSSPSIRSTWLRVHVTNRKGRRVAKNCRAYLVGIAKLPEREDVFPNDVRQMYWMHDDPQARPGARDLLPGVAHWIDVAGAIEGDPLLKVCVSPPWALKSPGEYVFTIQVSAEEAVPASVKVRGTWDGRWHSLRGDPFG